VENIGRLSEPNSRDNEDFCFTGKVSSIDLLIVGDFAQSEFVGIDAAATNELERLLQDPSILAAANASVSILLTQLASKFNGRLLTFHENLMASFQCSVVFAAIRGAVLYHLPVGDCRIAVQRGSSLILLNGSVWLDSVGRPLPNLIHSTQEMRRGTEPAPDQALGVSPDITFSTTSVQDFRLQPDDLILLYSDGVDKVVSPARVLELIEKRTANESLQVVVERILEEVRLERGNDDRTLLIAGGPHIATEAPAAIEIRKQAEEIENVKKTLDQTSGKIQTLETNVAGQIERIEHLVRQVAQTVKSLPTSADLKAHVSARLPDNNTLNKIQGSVESLRHQVESINQRLSPGGAPNPKGKPRVKHTEHFQNAKLPVANPAPAPASTSLEDQQLALSEVNVDVSFREGLIRTQQGSYELVDESHAFRDNSPHIGKHIDLWEAKAAKPGWLTAFYLYLRQLPEQPVPEATEATVTEWVRLQFETGAQQVANLTPDQLRNARRAHWRLRDARIKPRIFRSTRGLMIEEEKRLAREIFKTNAVNSGPINTGSKYYRDDGDVSRVLDTLTKPWGVLTIIAVIAVIIAIFYIITSPGPESQPPSQSGPAPRASDAVRLEYGADGRTLIASSRGGRPQLLDYRIAFGKEKEFRTLFANTSFESLEALSNKIENDARSLVVSPTDTLSLPYSQEIRSVETTDLGVSAQPANETCTRFLRRVNNKLPSTARNSIEDIHQLNPGLRCQDLKPNDVLLVFVQPNRR
jgi:serine/threonine protein phosphatase PrpC